MAAYGKAYFSGRGGMRYGFEVFGRSGGQAAAGGLRNFPGLAGTAGPQLQTASCRSENDRLSLAHARAPRPHWMPAGAGETGTSRADLREPREKRADHQIAETPRSSA